MLLDARATMGRRAWGWVVRHQGDFFAATGDHRSDDGRRLKSLSELALIAGALIDEMREARELLARAWEQIGEGEHIARHLHRRPTVALAYLPFLFAGYRSPALDERLAEVSWLRDHACLAPFARFGIGVILQMIGVTLLWDEVEVVRANRFLDSPTRQLPPFHAELLAHAVMWRSEMGRFRAGLSADAVEQYGRVSSEWHRLLLEAQLLDPLGEMIIADLCVGREPPVPSVALLCRAQHDDGAMPFRPGDAINGFDDVYHTTLVAALAGTLSTSARQREPARWQNQIG
jgi:hypothetical protein